MVYVLHLIVEIKQEKAGQNVILVAHDFTTNHLIEFGEI